MGSKMRDPNLLHNSSDANGSNLYPSVNALNYKSNDFCMSPTSPMSTNSICILLHNVEGLNYLLPAGYLTFLQEFDLILRNETLCTDPVALKEFQCVNINAVLKGKGRPSGGIVIGLSSAFTDWRVLETDNCLCVAGKPFSIICSYFRPLTSLSYIKSEISEILNQLDCRLPMMLAGDFNLAYKIDVSCPANKFAEFLLYFGLNLRSFPNQWTYASHNSM
ncbi:hypothetical protein GJ496_010876 [Pomphorhynchus laevis]|nr:hypothetical protein GJ496_010876 [Pomphorhynchus laevis]